MEWKISHQAVAYPDAMQEMERRVQQVQRGDKEELVWLLEHPPLYTAGTSAKSKDLLQGAKGAFPVYETGRGGQYTYHGPGQRIAYMVMDLNKRNPDLRAYVKDLEKLIIDCLKHFDINGFTRDDRIGVWVKNGASEAKIAALGVRVQKWVTSHGVAINVAPDLSHYSGIVPCGISTFGVTSMKALGVDVSMEEVDAALQRSFEDIFRASI
ncbi:MAG: lipoyl(octanoyl) transferase LipB [Alphaproteobacteria bacterium]|nr:lipoyl(octanoyl) transferase LipB [Alphaproteobacteria bacterium]